MESVLITGASRGLGFSLAEAYAASGFFVIACARQIGSEKLRALKEKYGEQILLAEMDVAATDSVEKAAAQVGQAISGIDIIINNAAVQAQDTLQELEKVNVDHCLDTYNINTLGALRVAKAFLPLLEKGREQALVNISSEAGSIADCRREKEFDYCMSKAALNMQTKLLSNYLAHREIALLAIHPGWMRTDMGGPNASISSVQAAEGLLSIIKDYRHGKKGPMYIDYTGQPLNY